jgi:hypothetical protein
LEAFNDMFVAYTSEKVASLINVIKQSLKYWSLKDLLLKT